MAGTGKSRVLTALMAFLDQRGESHRFIVLGPTGASASLIGGSTYHSALGLTVSDDSGSHKSHGRALDKVRERLEDVELVF